MARILVLHDDTTIAGLLEAALGLAEHDVTMSHSAADAMARLRQRTFDAMLLGIDTPDLCGIDVLELAEALPDRARMPVVVIGGEEGPSSARRSHQPLAVGALLETIERALAGSGRKAASATERAPNYLFGS